MVQNSKIGYKILSPKSILRPSIITGIIASLLVGGISFYTVKYWQYSGNLETQSTVKKLPKITTVTDSGTPRTKRRGN